MKAPSLSLLLKEVNTHLNLLRDSNCQAGLPLSVGRSIGHSYGDNTLILMILMSAETSEGIASEKRKRKRAFMTIPDTNVVPRALYMPSF